MAPTVLVTRPEPQASHWVRGLIDQGVRAQALPVMATLAPRDPAPVTDLWRSLLAPTSTTPRWRALMFVSPAAAQWFFRQRPTDLTSQPWPQGTMLAAPGPGSAQALREALGATPATIVHPPADAEQFDSEHLWPVLAPLSWADQDVAIISGGDAEQASGRTWLTERWRDAGARVHTILTYQRGPATWGPGQCDLARVAWQAPAEHLWLASSSDALALLHTHHLPKVLGADAPQQATRQHRLLATHPRIADNALRWGWQDVRLCPPTLEAVARAAHATPHATPD